MDKVCSLDVDMDHPPPELYTRFAIGAVAAVIFSYRPLGAANASELARTALGLGGWPTFPMIE